jgi:hypothetical protein
MAMTTVNLGVDKAWRVFATDEGGNRDLDGGTEITWDARTPDSPGWVTTFKVTFQDSETGNPTWPFTKKVNGEDAPDDHFEVLDLIKGTPKTFVTRSGYLKTVKYVVAADGNPPGDQDKVTALDPTIIIRPGLRSIIAAGLPWAAAGAAVGALVTAVVLME